MREAFRQWLDRQGYTDKTQSTQRAQANRLEKHYGDLDVAYDADRFSGINSELEYSKEDKRNGRANPSEFVIDGDLYANQEGIISPRIVDGRFHIASLQCPGFGFAVEPDMESMATPESWSFESLGL